MKSHDSMHALMRMTIRVEWISLFSSFNLVPIEKKKWKMKRLSIVSYSIVYSPTLSSHLGRLMFGFGIDMIELKRIWYYKIIHGRIDSFGLWSELKYSVEKFEVVCLWEFFHQIMSYMFKLFGWSNQSLD